MIWKGLEKVYVLNLRPVNTYFIYQVVYILDGFYYYNIYYGKLFIHNWHNWLDLDMDELMSKYEQFGLAYWGFTVWSYFMYSSLTMQIKNPYCERAMWILNTDWLTKMLIVFGFSSPFECNIGGAN